MQVCHNHQWKARDGDKRDHGGVAEKGPIRPARSVHLLDHILVTQRNKTLLKKGKVSILFYFSNLSLLKTASAARVIEVAYGLCHLGVISLSQSDARVDFFLPRMTDRLICSTGKKKRKKQQQQLAPACPS